jgi:hypothetical protein
MTHNDTTSDTSDALALAIDYLGAVEVAPGRYAYPDHDHFEADRYPHPPCRWRVSGADAMIDACARGLDNAEAVRIHLAATIGGGVLMPSWWTPERQYAYRLVVVEQEHEPSDECSVDDLLPGAGEARYESIHEVEQWAGDLVPRALDLECITAYLDTGEEVEA